MELREFPRDRTKAAEKSRALSSEAKRLRDLWLVTERCRNNKTHLTSSKEIGWDEHIGVRGVIDLGKKCEHQAKERSRLESAHRFSQWKSNMRKDCSMRLTWLTRPF